MKFDLTFDLLAWVLLSLLALLFCRFWQGGQRASTVPKPPKGKRDPKPFAGYTRKRLWCMNRQSHLETCPDPACGPLTEKGRRIEVFS